MIRKAVVIWCVGLSLLLVVASCSKIPCYSPEYFDPPPHVNYIAEEIRVLAPAGHRLAGTLTIPSDRKPPFPAVALITGSSPQNRDMMNHWAWPTSAYKPFRQIADALTTNGIAVLRMDDRGCGCSEEGHFLKRPLPSVSPTIAGRWNIFENDRKSIRRGSRCLV